MEQNKAMLTLKHVAMVTAVAAWAVTQLTACVAVQLPPIPVTLTIAQDVELSALAASSGSANITLGPVCDLFNDEEVDALVRAQAGDLIADMVNVTAIELDSTDIVASTGDFAAFNMATLELTILEPGGETLLLGTAADNDGLGDMFTLTLNMPVDFLNDLEEDDCGSPTLRLEGADPFEPGDVTFDVSVNLLVYTEFVPQ